MCSAPPNNQVTECSDSSSVQHTEYISNNQTSVMLPLVQCMPVQASQPLNLWNWVFRFSSWSLYHAPFCADLEKKKEHSITLAEPEIDPLEPLYLQLSGKPRFETFILSDNYGSVLPKSSPRCSVTVDKTSYDNFCYHYCLFL